MLKVRSFSWIGNGRPFSFVGAGVSGGIMKLPKVKVSKKKKRK